MAWGRKTAMRSGRLASLAMLTFLPGLTACGGFFTCEGKTSCGTTGISDTGDVVYVSNSGSTSLYAYFIASDGSLNNVSGSPYTLSYAPTSAVVTPDNSLLYVSGTSGITSFVVSSGGVLNNKTQQSTAVLPSASMAVSPNGKWLIALDAQTLTSTVPLIRTYTIGTGGALGTPSNSATISSTFSVNPTQVAISPDGKYVAAALGNAGVLVWQFDETAGGTGALTSAVQLGTASTTTAEFSVAFDSTDNVYVAQSGTNTGIAVYSPTGTLLSPAAGPYGTGNAPRSLLFAASYSYLYDANQADGTIGAFTDASTVLKSVGNATTGPAAVQALAVDSTGKYVVGAGTSGSGGLQIFTIGSSGGLTAGKTATAGTSNAAPVLAVTH